MSKLAEAEYDIINALGLHARAAAASKSWSPVEARVDATVERMPPPTAAISG